MVALEQKLALAKSSTENKHLREPTWSGEQKPDDKPAASEKLQLSVIVEDVRSLFNVGSIFRTADGAGADRLYLCGYSGTPPRKEIAKVSLGAEDVLDWTYHLSALEPILKLRAAGHFILGLECTQNSIELKDALSQQRIAYPVCLVVGNEVTGVSPEVLEHCDLVCHLPMRGLKESLNVAVAFGVAAYMLAEKAPAIA
jgi:tRNA G18 (ribose-2'-O)-methylase SpoU